MAASLVVLVSFDMVMTSLEGFALRQRVPPWVAIWAPNIVFAVIGATLLVVTAREWRPRVTVGWRTPEGLRGRLPRGAADSPARLRRGPTNSTHILDPDLIREF